MNHPTMFSNYNLQKTNWGTLRILPEVCVDRFGKYGRSHVNWKRSKVFFLTHYDDDMIYDVINKKFLTKLQDGTEENGPRLFMHELVFSYIKYWLNNSYDPTRGDYIPDIVLALLEKLVEMNKIIMLDINVPIELRFTGDGGSLIKVTPLSAGSQIGSIMLLLETELNSDMIRVLYTGDCRLIRKDYRECHPLHNPDGTPKYLNKIYIDTTYCLPTVKEFPCRGHSVFQLVDVLDRARVNNRSYNVHFNFSGGQAAHNARALAHIAEELCENIHVSPGLSEHLKNVEQIGSRFTARDDLDEEYGIDRQFHYGCSRHAQTHDRENDAKPTKEILVELGCDVSMGTDLLDLTESQYHWLHAGKASYTSTFGSIHHLYSSHLSRFELGRFINYFNVDCRNVLPLYKPRRMPMYLQKLLVRSTCQQVRNITEPEFVRQDAYSTWYDCTNLEKPASAKRTGLQSYTFQ